MNITRMFSTNVLTAISRLTKLPRSSHNMNSVVLEIPIVNIKTPHSLWHPGAYIVATRFPKFLAADLAFEGFIHIIIEADCDTAVLEKRKVCPRSDAVMTLDASTDEGLKNMAKLFFVIFLSISSKNQLKCASCVEINN